MSASLLNILVIGIIFFQGFFLAMRPIVLNGRSVGRVVLWNVGIFLALGLMIQIFPALIDPR